MPTSSTRTDETVDVDLGGRTVPVPTGGLYDRYRMDTDLDEIARDPRVPGVEFFRDLPKTAVQSRIGPTLTPNYYYRMSVARLGMLAPSRAIRASRWGRDAWPTTSVPCPRSAPSRKDDPFACDRVHAGGDSHLPAIT